MFLASIVKPSINSIAYQQVHMHTLQCLETLCNEEPLVLQQNLLQIVAPALLSSASNTNKYVSSLHMLSYF
jgi:hypothetical protein